MTIFIGQDFSTSPTMMIHIIENWANALHTGNKIMQTAANLISVLKEYGVGRRKIDDVLFIHDKPPLRLGIYDIDKEEYCHAATPIKCTVPGCNFTANSLLQFESHYNASHRYSCSQCKKVSPSPHLLDLHIQEQHDSFFAVMATKKPSFSCYIEECKEKFLNTEERIKHCVNAHKLPKDFRFDYTQKKKLKIKKTESHSMDTDNGTVTTQKFNFTNSKQKGFKNYTGKKFPKEQDSSASVDLDAIMTDLRDNLPQP